MTTHYYWYSTCITHQWNWCYLKNLPNIELSKSVCSVTMFFQFSSPKSSWNMLLQYPQNLEENIQTLLVTNYNKKTYKAPQQNLNYVSLLTSCSQELTNYRNQLTMSHTQLYNMFNTCNQSKHSCTKHRIIHLLFNFLFCTSSNTEEINPITNNMEILKGNKDTLSNQIKQTFNFVNLTYTESNTNRLLLSSLQKDIVQIISTVHHLSKQLKALILDRNFFVLMCNWEAA